MNCVVQVQIAGEGERERESQTLQGVEFLWEDQHGQQLNIWFARLCLQSFSWFTMNEVWTGGKSIGKGTGEELKIKVFSILTVQTLSLSLHRQIHWSSARVNFREDK